MPAGVGEHLQRFSGGGWGQKRPSGGVFWKEPAERLCVCVPSTSPDHRLPWQGDFPRQLIASGSRARGPPRNFSCALLREHWVERLGNSARPPPNPPDLFHPISLLPLLYLLLPPPNIKKHPLGSGSPGGGKRAVPSHSDGTSLHCPCEVPRTCLG